MISSILIWSYRAVAALITASPIILNILMQGSIVTSLLYVPIASLILAAIFIYAEHHVLAMSCHCGQLTKTGQKLLKQRLSMQPGEQFFHRLALKITPPCCRAH